jgi:hypothetical protein
MLWSKQVCWVALALACAIGITGALASGTRTASAVAGDVCQITAFDSNGHVINDGGEVGGNGVDVYMVFRVEDDPFGLVKDLLLDVSGQDIINNLNGQIAGLQAQIGVEAQADPDEVLIENLQAQIAAHEVSLANVEAAIQGVLDTDIVEIDSITGSAQIRSRAEVVGFASSKPNVDHVLINPGVSSQRVDHVWPNFFNHPDGHPLDSISAWLEEVAGVTSPGEFDNNVCGGPTVDGWGFVDIGCTEAGRFRVNVTAQRESSENISGAIDLVCPGGAGKAEISSQRATVETQPTNVGPSGFGAAVITVTVWDEAANRHDGALVTFTTDSCQFRNTDPAGAYPVSPVDGAPTVTTVSDTDTTADDDFLADNPLEDEAGTAEVLLNCTLPESAPSVARVTAVVEREGADIVLDLEVKVVGPTAAPGLTLTLEPKAIECGEKIEATARAVDAAGQPVSPGTKIFFTSDNSSGVVGGDEGAKGVSTTLDGVATVLIATDPSKGGVRTVIAYVVNNAGTPNAQVSETYECEGSVSPFGGMITPPSTGDAGLAAVRSR